MHLKARNMTISANADLFWLALPHTIVSISFATWFCRHRFIHLTREFLSIPVISSDIPWAHFYCGLLAAFAFDFHWLPASCRRPVRSEEGSSVYCVLPHLNATRVWIILLLWYFRSKELAIILVHRRKRYLTSSRSENLLRTSEGSHSGHLVLTSHGFFFNQSHHRAEQMEKSRPHHLINHQNINQSSEFATLLHKLYISSATGYDVGLSTCPQHTSPGLRNNW